MKTVLRTRLATLWVLLTLTTWALAETTSSTPNLSKEQAVQDLVLFTQKYTNPPPLVAGPYDSNISRLTTRILEQMHYLRHPLDDVMAAKFLDRYLDRLDGPHFHFIQSDIKEFEAYRTNLATLTGKAGDTEPGDVIFNRFFKRIEQRVEYVGQLLQTEKFEFTGDDRYIVNRKGLDWPTDLTAARELWHQQLRYEYLQEKLNGQKPDEILKTLANRYKRLLRTYSEFESDDVLQVYLTALCEAYDPHSDYMGKAQLDNFAIGMKLSLFGIGALLREDDGYCKIVELLPGGPALRSKKLKPEDKIIAVQQTNREPVDVIGLKLSKVVELIRGPKGTQVTLTFIPADATDPSVKKTLTLVRDEIKLEDQEAKARIYDFPEADGKSARLGVIDLPTFYASLDLGSNPNPAAGAEKPSPKSTTADVARLLRKLVAERVDGVVLDLRRNPGGSLEEAIKLTGLFIKEGPIVQVRDALNEVTVESDPDAGVLYDGPLVVLTSRFSASASEILAAALQDYGRALIVGDTSTHGKGTVQTIYELQRFMRQRFPTNFDPGAVKLTIRKFYRATGSSTQLKGVTPDIVLPSITSYMDVGESAQENALQWDTIPAAKFEHLDRVQPFLEQLRKHSLARQQTDKDFSYLREDIELFRKAQADKSVSLNEAQRRKEKQEQDARRKARNQERLARGEPKGKVYEITLKLADQPGLPPALTKTNDTPAKAEGVAEAKPADAAEAEAEDKAPPVDVVLEEGKHILVDLIAMSSVPGKPLPVASIPLPTSTSNEARSGTSAVPR